jgi:putative ABC transport system ATP-binding protein
VLLQLVDVSKSYSGATGRISAMDRVSLTLSAGDFASIQGPSGCGKSTLLLTAGTLLQPDSGEVRVMGQSVTGLSASQRASLRSNSIGFVFQQFHLVPYLSVLDNVLAPSLAAKANGQLARAQSLLERFGLAPRAGHVPAQLSSGERQRCALARALLNQPRLLLADEPTGNLDEENAEIVLTSLKDFAKAGGAVLLVTHDSRAAGYATMQLRMNSGRLEAGQECGAHAPRVP